MTDFYYGQEIYADDLNNIAIDLGNTSFSSFKNEKPYAVDQLNQITASIVGKGITTNGNKLSVDISKDRDAIIINNGVGIFSSGKKFRLTTPLTIPFQVGELFIENAEAENKVSVKIGVLPTENDYIHLATIAEDGTITDMRAYAKANVNLTSEGNSYSKKISFDTVSPKTPPIYVNLSITDVSKVFLKMSYTEYNALFLFDTKKNVFSGFQNIGGKEYSWKDDTEVKIGNIFGSIYYVIISYVSNEKDILTLKFDFKKTTSSFSTPFSAEFFVYGGL